MTTYTLYLRSEGGGEDTVALHASSPADARAAARAETEDWVRDGAWPEEGATVRAWWRLLDADGDLVSDGSVSVDIEPDHEALIRDAVGRYRLESVCGSDPEDHEWTTDGEGGSAENPGVWSLGGTAMLFRSHCRRCVLRRYERSAGSQRNPGESDTSGEYEMADSRQIARWREIGAMD